MSDIIELFLTFSKIGAFTFGGGYAMIPLIENQCVEKKKWFTHDEFMNMTVIAESTPGPIAINCATYVGYKKAKLLGAIFATFGVVIPSFIVILIVSLSFENMLKYKMIKKAFIGIRIAVAVLIIQAGENMVKELMKNKHMRLVKVVIISLFFVTMLMLNIFNINLSLIYMLFVAALLGCIIFKEGEVKE